MRVRNAEGTGRNKRENIGETKQKRVKGVYAGTTILDQLNSTTT